MSSVAALIYAATGSPSIADPLIDGVCRLCGEEGTGQPWVAWIKDTFTDADKLTPGSIICHACLFCVDDDSVVLTERAQRVWRTEADAIAANPERVKKWRVKTRAAKTALPQSPQELGIGRHPDGCRWWIPQRMRNYSHLVTRAGRWIPAMKNEKRAIAAALLDGDDPPAAAVISLAGQKHLILRARVGQWQIEEAACWPDPVRLAQLLPAVEALYAAGATKTMIASGVYTQAFLRAALAAWQEYEPAVQRARGSLLCQLAIWLAQKPTEDPADD